MRLKPWRDRRGHDAADHRIHGGVIERDGAVERHVMLGHAVGDGRRHHHRRRLLHDPRGAVRHLVHAAPVDHAGQVRPVLLGGADRHDDDGVARRQRLDLRGLEPRPVDFAHAFVLQRRQRRHRHAELFWCSRSSSPFMVLKKMKLSSQRTRLCSPMRTPMWAGLRRMVNLSSNSLFGLRFCRSGMIRRVGGEQLGLAGEIGGRRRGVVLGAHDLRLGIHRRQADLLRRALGGGDLVAAELVGRRRPPALLGP